MRILVLIITFIIFFLLGCWAYFTFPRDSYPRIIPIPQPTQTILDQQTVNGETCIMYASSNGNVPTPTCYKQNE